MIMSTSHEEAIHGGALLLQGSHELYWGLLQRLGWPGTIARTLGVSSCSGGEGVSMVAASLAATAASSGLGRVLLIDANRDRPSAHRLLGVKPAPGLAEALADRTARANVQQSAVTGLAVLAAGDDKARAARLWAAPALAEILAALKDEFSLVIIDLPPAGEAGFVAPLSGLLDGVLLVVEAERVRGEAVRRHKDLLAAANARLLGVVLNKQRRQLPAGLDRFL